MKSSNIGPGGEYYHKIDFSPVYDLYTDGLIKSLVYKILSSVLYLINKKKNNDYVNRIGINSAICGGFVDTAYAISLFKFPITISEIPLEEYIINHPKKTINILGLVNAQKAAFILGLMSDIGLMGYGIWRIIRKSNAMKVKDYKKISDKIK